MKKYQDRPVKIEVGPKEINMKELKHHFWIIKKRKIIVTCDVIEKVGRTMIFCRTRRGVDRVARELKDERLRVAAIHGGLTQRQRDRDTCWLPSRPTPSPPPCQTTSGWGPFL